MGGRRRKENNRDEYPKWHWALEMVCAAQDMNYKCYISLNDACQFASDFQTCLQARGAISNAMRQGQHKGNYGIG